MEVVPIRWKGDRLELLDQRLLPDQTVYVTCRTAEDVAAAIRDMVVRGAPAIGCARHLVWLFQMALHNRLRFWPKAGRPR
jgi:methylthioribose-1-phosphate isomerase